MRKAVQLGMVLVMAALAAWPAAAQESRIYREGEYWVQVITGTVPAAKNLKIVADSGSVQLSGGPRSNVSYTVKKKFYGATLEIAARRQLEMFRISAYQKGEWTVVAGKREGDYGRMSVEFTVNAPRDLALAKIQTEGGSVGVNNIAGKVVANTSGGSISLDEIGGTVIAETAGGSIHVGKVGGDVKLETAGGGINVTSSGGEIIATTAGGSIAVGKSARTARLETLGGSINVKECGGELHATTAGGSVEAGDVHGSATLETSGGSIRVGGARGVVRASTHGGGMKLMSLTTGVEARTAAGPITAEFITRPGQFTPSFLETSMGDIVVYLPPDLPVNVRAIIDNSFGHKIRSEFSEVKVSSEGGQWGPREVWAEGAINGGGPLLKIHTTQGNIELRKGRK